MVRLQKVVQNWADMSSQTRAGKCGTTDWMMGAITSWAASACFTCFSATVLCFQSLSVFRNSSNLQKKT